jgi:acetylornithine deacetylase/succinyl-diaminopimelate desuccinylase-like protein
MSGSLQDRAVALLQQLIQLDTVNPPGRETTAQEPLAALLRAAGFEVELVGPDPERLNLVARLRGAAPGPVLGLLSHVDTVAADPRDWTHGPWSGALADGCVWGRGAIDMKSQTAAETVAACSLAQEGWRPAAGDLVVISVADEEVAGTGAEWLCANRPDLARCDFLINEGDGALSTVGEQRVHGVCVGEKGVFRFRLTARGASGHASMPAIADNALLRLAPLLARFAVQRPAWDVTPAAAATLTALGLDAGDPAAALAALTERAPGFAPLVEPTLHVTFAPTMVSASVEMNTIPAEAHAWVDCRVPPGLGRETALARLRELLGGEDGWEVEFTEEIRGNASPADSPLMDALRRFVGGLDAEAICLPTVSPGYSDSRTFREAFPDCVAYGFFPQRAMTAEEAAPLFHAVDERIPVADLGLAVDCYRTVAVDILGAARQA